MHDAAHEWISRFASNDPVRVVDFGGRNINGSAMDHFPNADRTVLDIAPGPGVDIVADAATWIPDRQYAVVVCAEVLEHARMWRVIVPAAFAALVAGGEFVVTTAGPGRAPHNATDGGAFVPQGEYYANVDPQELELVLKAAGFVDVLVDQSGEDVRAYARRP